MKFPNYLILVVGLLLPLILVILVIGFYFGMKHQKNLTLKKEESLVVTSPVTETPVTETNGVIYSSPIPTIRPLSTISTPPVSTTNYPVPQSWTRTMMFNLLMLCLPPKWEADQWGNVYFNRDPAYRPDVTYIQEIPYKGGSRREAYFQFWEREYPSVRQTVKVDEVALNRDTVLKFNGPESEKIVWLAKGKLWQAGISNWEWVNDSKAAFFRDFYTMIGCSFGS